MIKFNLLKQPEEVAVLHKGSGAWVGARPIGVDAGQNPVLILRSSDGSLGAAIMSNEPASTYSNKIEELLGSALKKFSGDGFSIEKIEAAVVGGANNAGWKWSRLVKILQQQGMPFKKFDEGGLFYREIFFDPKRGSVAIYRTEANPDDWNPASAKLSLDSGTKGFSEGNAGGVVANATRFFRETPSFTALRELVVPAHLSQTPDEPLLIWSAACSTGAEAYSYAMYTHRLLKLAGASCPFKILATDINAKLVEEAKKGVYKARKNELEEFRAYFNHYGTVRGDVVHFNENIKRCITFNPFDLKNRPRAGGFRMIVCANVFQYYDDDARTHFLQNFISALASPGYLFVGPLKDHVFKPLGLKKLSKYKMFLME
jgi:chemotaxis methyl-accepting protein methylase